jgi:hypothetical protein
MKANSVTRTSLVTLALAALSFSGCTASRSMAYTVVIDTDMSADQNEDILKSMDAWMTAVPGLKLTPVIASCNGTGSYVDHTICIFIDHGTPEDLNVMGTTHWDNAIESNGDSATCHIWQEAFADPVVIAATHAFLNIVTHELGHAITHNGSHLTDGNVMMPAIPAGEAVGVITHADVAYFWAARQ